MITVSALFTQSGGDPATGLTLADIDLYLLRRAKATGAVSAVWNPQNPTEEVGGGIYTRAYTGEDWATYQYFGYAHYTGATSLDSDYSLYIGVNMDPSETLVGPGDSANTYTVTDSSTGLPLEDCEIWATTDAAGTNIVAYGVSNAAGQVTFFLTAGVTYYIWHHKAGYLFAVDPDLEIAT